MRTMKAQTFLLKQRSLSLILRAARREGEPARSSDHAMPGQPAGGGQMFQGSADKAGMVGVACQTGNLAIAGDLPGRDQRDNLPDYAFKA